MATTKPEATEGATASDVADSANKTNEQKSAQLKAGVDPKAEAPAAVLNHGEPDPYVEQQKQAFLDSLKDPYGDRPLQMRDEHDPLVDPQVEDQQIKEDGLKPSGLEPGRTNLLVPEDRQVQGTLPPL